jgi:hypothetical protein
LYFAICILRFIFCRFPYYRIQKIEVFLIHKIECSEKKNKQAKHQLWHLPEISKMDYPMEHGVMLMALTAGKMVTTPMTLKRVTTGVILATALHRRQPHPQLKHHHPSAKSPVLIAMTLSCTAWRLV